MRSFVFYFYSWLEENRASADNEIPDFFFYQTPNAQKLINGYMDSDLNKISNEIKAMCEREWVQGSQFKHLSCGIDFAIYSRGRAFRIAGVCKPNKLGDTPRFLRPCTVTKWWSINLGNKSIEEDILRMKVPPKEHRREWARASLLMVPAPRAVNITVPQPKGCSWKEPESDDNHVVLPRPSPQDITEEWRWMIDTDRFVHPTTRRREFSGIKSIFNHVGENVVPMELDVGENSEDAGFIYLLDDDRVRRYEKRGGQWYNVIDGTTCEEIEHIKKQAYHIIQDKFVRYWNDRVEMRLRSLRHMEDASYGDQGPEEYARLRDELESSMQTTENISILYIDDITQGAMFTNSNVTIDPQFKLVTGDGDVVRLGDITNHTIIFCPKHEIDCDTQSHEPSAFADVDRVGRRFIWCSRCGTPGMSIRETVREKDVLDETWEDLNKQYGDGCVRFITEPYFEMKHLLWWDVDHNDNISEHSAYSLATRHAFPPVYIGISRMGTGKTTLLQRLTDLDLDIVMEKFGFDAFPQPSILSISPRRDLA